jgi:hypothetical protein
MAAYVMRGFDDKRIPWKDQPLGRPSDALIGFLRSCKYTGMLVGDLSLGTARTIFTNKPQSVLEGRLEHKMAYLRVPDTKFGTVGEVSVVAVEMAAVMGSAAVMGCLRG